jgi:hypothetical protein
MDLVFSYATSLELRAKTGTTPSANTEVDSKFLEQSIANTLSGAKTFKVSTSLSVGSNFSKTFNLTDLTNIKHVRALLIKSSQLIKIEVNTDLVTNPDLIQTFRTKFCFIDFAEPDSGFQSLITQSTVTVTNLSNSSGADVTLIAVGY